MQQQILQLAILKQQNRIFQIVFLKVTFLNNEKKHELINQLNTLINYY